MTEERATVPQRLVAEPRHFSNLFGQAVRLGGIAERQSGNSDWADAKSHVWRLRVAVNGNLLCGARSDGMLVRLGKENEVWALEIPGVVPMMTRGRQMRGWVRAAPHVYGNDALRQRLVDVALEFNRSLPKK
jgi:hypothetical protein